MKKFIPKMVRAIAEYHAIIFGSENYEIATVAIDRRAIDSPSEIYQWRYPTGVFGSPLGSSKTLYVEGRCFVYHGYIDKHATGQILHFDVILDGMKWDCKVEMVRIWVDYNETI